MKKNTLLRRLCSLVMVAALCAPLIPARAADAISVRLDETPMTFTDARPIMRDNRTFVPFRAIFEGMGATVGWDDKTRTVTATRSGRTVSLTIGRLTVSVDNNGTDATFMADVAPFIEGGRTYVPVRFAAQALGAAVGWDGASQTVLIVDTEKRIAQRSGKYQALGAMTAFARDNTPSGAYTVSGTVDALWTFHTPTGDQLVNLTGSLKGAEDSQATQLAVNLSLDRPALEAALSQYPADDPAVKTLRTLPDAPTFDLILSRADGKIYLKSVSLTGFGIPSSGWVMKDYGMAGALTALQQGDVTGLLCALAQQLTLRPGESTAQVDALLDGLSDASGYLPDPTADNSYGLRYSAPDGSAVELQLLPGLSLTAVRTTASGARIESTMMAGETTVRVASDNTLYGLSLSMTLTRGGSTSAPAVRPS